MKRREMRFRHVLSSGIFLFAKMLQRFNSFSLDIGQKKDIPLGYTRAMPQRLLLTAGRKNLGMQYFLFFETFACGYVFFFINLTYTER